MSVSNTTRLFAAAAAIVMTGGLFILPAYAAPGTETRIAVVSTSGLDLSTSQGAVDLNARVHDAASSLCGEPVMDDGRELAAVRQCRAGAIEATMPQIRAAIDSAIHIAQVRTSGGVQVSSR